MGNCFQPKVYQINPVVQSDSRRVQSYSQSIPLSSGEYISSLYSDGASCALAQDNFVSVVTNFSIKSHFDAFVGNVKCVSVKGDHVFAGGKVIRQLTSRGERVSEMTGHDLPATTVDCCPKADLLASGSRDYSVRVWDINTQKTVVTSKVNWNVVTYVKWLPERQLLAQCSEDLKLRLWDIREPPMRETLSIIVGNNFATRCDVSEDLILTAHRAFNAEGCEAKMWDIRQEKLLVTFSGHKQSVESAVFCSGKVFTCSGDGGVRRFGVDGTMEECWQHPSRHPFLHMVPYKDGLLAATSPPVLHFFSPVDPQLLHAMGTLAIGEEEIMDVPASVRPPLESYRYFPPPDLIFKGSGTHIQRFIFSHQAFTPFEAEKLTRLKAALSSQQVAVPPHWDDTVLLRLAYGTHWKTRNAVASVVKHIEWRQATLSQDYRLLYPTVRGLLESGCLYVHGRDCRYRPCIIMHYPKFNFKEVMSTQHSIDEYMPLIGFFLDYVIDNMFLPGQIENWVTVTDMGSMGLSDMPITVSSTQHIRRLIETLQGNYRCRLAHNYVINAPKSVSVIWAIVKKFLDKDTVERISITGKSSDREMLMQFNPAQVERRYGGSAPDLVSYWPPVVPDGPFEAPGQAPGALLSAHSSFPKEVIPATVTVIDAPAPAPLEIIAEAVIPALEVTIQPEPILVTIGPTSFTESATPATADPSSSKDSIVEYSGDVWAREDESAHFMEIQKPRKYLHTEAVEIEEPVTTGWGCSCGGGDNRGLSSCAAF